MRIGVIAAEMEGRSTGVGRSLEGLLHGLSSWDHGCEWHLFFQGGAVPDSVPVCDWVVGHCAGREGSAVLWEQFGLVKELDDHELDVLFGPSYSLPMAYRGPSAVTIHDLSFELYPCEFTMRERWRRRFLARRSVRAADHVFAPTEFIRSQLIDRYAVSPDEVSPLPHGVNSERFNPRPMDGDREVLAGLGIDRPFMLWLGTIFERRVPRVVLEAFFGIRKRFPDLRLVVAGTNRLRDPARFAGWINDFGLSDAVHELGWVEERILAPLYREALLAVYVSRYEGFGMPPLECLACGTPVVVSGGLGLDDLWPDYPLRCREISADAIDETATALLESPEMATVIASEAAVRSPTWSWESSSRALVAELRKVARR